MPPASDPYIKYARLPEALDRGGLYLTIYLKEYLRKLGLAPSECEASFAILTQPVIPSILAQELLDFEDIVEKARADKLTLATGSHGRARMFLCPELLLRLQTHLDKWKYLPYHGYGRRDLATLGQYIERLVEHLNQPGEGGSTSTLRQRARQAELDRQEVLKKLGMDRAHQALFSVYPEIGAVKLYRRYAQLRNFYYLDLLLAEIADRIGINEWTLRCMLPEEIVSSLKAGRLTGAAVLERSSNFMYGLLANQECLVTGNEAQELRRLLQVKTSSRRDDKVLIGTVASRGTVVGPCKVIIRADDHRESFSPGSIVVSESTDPDLIGILKNAGGVLTEQGGVTSHAAIICRELGVPTIIGIEGLLDQVKDGDVVKVDALRGQVTMVEEKTLPRPGTIFASDKVHSPDVIGGKAHNLDLVRSLGFSVPEYVVVSYEGIKRLLEQPSNGACKRLVHWTLEQLNLPAESKLALRSSAVNEDRENGSHAGEFCSLLHIGRDQLAAGFRKFIKSNSVSKNRRRYRGSIIVQQMIEGEYAGVCLTVDPRTGKGNTVIIEFICGSNESITQGTVLPDRVMVDRLTGDILEDQRLGKTLSSGVIDIADLVQQFMTLEAKFGQPLDIEWALVGPKLYILQARPIVQEVAGMRISG